MLFCVAAVLQAPAASWYVRTDGFDGDDGKSWDTAQGTIRLGIDNCKAGDTLFVEVGTYHEGIVLKDGVTIIGGCKAFEAFDRRSRSHSNKTILDGTDMNTRLVTCEQDMVLPTRLEDFVLQNARHDQRGGAAWLRGTVMIRMLSTFP